MPDLSDLDSLKKQLIALLLGFGDKGLSRKAGLYRRNFVRLVDKAIYEYQQARQDLIAEIEEEKRPAEELAKMGRTIYEFGFIDHLENCINAARRLLAIADRINSDGNAAVISRETRRLLESIGKDITKLRDVIEHVDEKIHKNEIKESQPVILSLSRKRDKVSIAGHHLELHQLALTLKKLHQVGVSFLDLSPKSWP